MRFCELVINGSITKILKSRNNSVLQYENVTDLQYMFERLLTAELFELLLVAEHDVDEVSVQVYGVRHAGVEDLQNHPHHLLDCSEVLKTSRASNISGWRKTGDRNHT